MNGSGSRKLLIFPLLLLAACGAPPQDTEDDGAVIGRTQEGWDSQDGNPTHATHSYLTERAIDALRNEYPELETFRAEIVDGANRELHDKPVSDPEQEALRVEAQGTNWACAKPEVFWNHALEHYRAGDKAKAYWLTGILLHMVEDMGVPAHALHVYHQASPWDWDDFEIMALEKWSPSYADVNRADPGLRAPADYVAWSGEWAANDFHESFPHVAYTRTFFPVMWLFASSKEKTFVKDRQGRTAMVATWALERAAHDIAAR